MSIRHMIEAAGVSLLERGVGALGMQRASDIGYGLFSRIGPRTRISRRALENLMRVFPEDKSRELLPRVWGNLGRTLFEYPHFRKLGAESIEVVGLEIIKDILASGSGCVFFSGHLANWEITPRLARIGDFDAAIMYRAPNNPRVAAVLGRCRAQERIRFIAKSHSGTREAFSVLARKEVVGLLIDHRFNRGVEVDFLGGRALVAPTAALMAKRFNCPLVPVRAERLEGCRFRITVHPPLAIDPNREDFAEAVMQSAMKTLEGWILERPDQWFWMQRLWL